MVDTIYGLQSIYRITKCQIHIYVYTYAYREHMFVLMPIALKYNICYVHASYAIHYHSVL